MDGRCATVGGGGKLAINEANGMGMIAIGDGRGMMDVGNGRSSSLGTSYGGIGLSGSATLGDACSWDSLVKLLGDLLVGDGDGGLLEVDVVEECKLGGLGGGDGGFLEVEGMEDCKLGGLGDGLEIEG